MHTARGEDGPACGRPALDWVIQRRRLARTSAVSPTTTRALAISARALWSPASATIAMTTSRDRPATHTQLGSRVRGGGDASPPSRPSPGTDTSASPSQAGRSPAHVERAVAGPASQLAGLSGAAHLGTHWGRLPVASRYRPDTADMTEPPSAGRTGALTCGSGGWCWRRAWDSNPRGACS